jgi:hypothetical protein
MANSTKTSSPPHRFALGTLVITPGAVKAFAGTGDWPAEYLQRHERGDWGQVGDADKKMNDAACANEGDADRQYRVLSAYSTKNKTRIWVVTEADRSVTTILLPEEY